MVDSSDIFDKNYQEYCAQLAKIDFGSIRDRLGLVTDGDRMFIPFFNRRFLVSNNGIVDISLLLLFSDRGVESYNFRGVPLILNTSLDRLLSLDI